MIHTGTKSVTAAGTAEALVSSHTPAAWVIVAAKRGNTNYVYVGDSTVTSSNGIPLAPGNNLPMPMMGGPNCYDLFGVYVDADTNGDGVNFFYGRT